MKSKSSGFKLTAVIACVVAMFCVGIVYLWSAFRQPVIDYYGWNPGDVSMVSSAIVFFYMVGTLIGGILNDKLGPKTVVFVGGIIFCIGLFTTSLLGKNAVVWPIYLTYGAVAGIGVGFVYSATLNCIQRWFPHRRGFATGISVCAFGLATVVFTPLIEAFLKNFSVPATFRILAFSFPVIVLICGFFICTPADEYIKTLKLPQSAAIQRQYTTGEAIKTIEWWSVSLALFFLPAPYMMMLPIIKSLGLERGLSETTATLVLSITGIVSAVSRLSCATVSDKLGRALTIWLMSVVCLVASLLFTFAKGGLYILAVMLVFFGYAGPSGVFAAMSTDAFGTKHIGATFGLSLMFLGVSSPVFTFISTKVNTTTAFVIAAVSCVVPLIVLPLYNVGRKKHKDRDMEIALQQQNAK